MFDVSHAMDCMYCIFLRRSLPKLKKPCGIRAMFINSSLVFVSERRTVLAALIAPHFLSAITEEPPSAVGDFKAKDGYSETSKLKPKVFSVCVWEREPKNLIDARLDAFKLWGSSCTAVVIFKKQFVKFSRQGRHKFSQNIIIFRRTFSKHRTSNSIGILSRRKT